MTTETDNYDGNNPHTRATSRDTSASGSIKTGIVGREDMYVHKGSNYVGREEIPSDARNAEFYKEVGLYGY
ncbi:hypothetical protein [uncultured Paraglaciecola sp.]|uniref:hypothetical protein n=1 Tax=uncultured Paraglaciecola sp. TaxID=1765024 RepID=UPI0026384E31|nr:hypothetical protein [uncultured Paraglaciecola sp.]